MLGADASTSMSTTVAGDTDMTSMREHFVSRRRRSDGFSVYPFMAWLSDRLTGSANRCSWRRSRS